jgi:hypothetical protein
VDVRTATRLALLVVALPSRRIFGISVSVGRSGRFTLAGSKWRAFALGVWGDAGGAEARLGESVAFGVFTGDTSSIEGLRPSFLASGRSRSQAHGMIMRQGEAPLQGHCDCSGIVRGLGKARGREHCMSSMSLHWSSIILDIRQFDAINGAFIHSRHHHRLSCCLHSFDFPCCPPLRTTLRLPSNGNSRPIPCTQQTCAETSRRSSAPRLTTSR